MPLHALESIFKLCDERGFTLLKTLAPHDALEIIATQCRVRIVNRQ